MDIDTDFQNQYRHVIVEYVQAKYGYDHVSQIVTYNMLGLKSIIRNVGKVLGIPYLVTDELSKNVPKKITKPLVSKDFNEGKNSPSNLNSP